MQKHNAFCRGVNPFCVSYWWSLNVTIHPPYIMVKRQESAALQDNIKKKTELMMMKAHNKSSTWIITINSILCVDLLTPFVLYFSEHISPLCSHQADLETQLNTNCPFSLMIK